MTQAVCFHCGEMKWGAFNGCEKCGSLPKSDDELMLSLMLTDHNLNADQLAYFGQSIKAGRPPVIPESEKVKLRPAVEEARKLLGIKRPHIETPVVVKHDKQLESHRHWMHRSLKATAALLAFVAIYFLVSTLIYLIVLYINGGSVFSPMSWRVFVINVFANAMAGYLGVAAGRALLDAYLTPYPPRFVGIVFIVLLGIWFVPLTLIYIMGGVSIIGGMDLEGWPPEGEFPEYILGLVRAVVAAVCAWVMLVKRDAKQSG